MPLLVTENYGRGRTAIVASGGVWRWQMSQPLGDTHSRYVLAATAALAGDRFTGASGGLGAESDAV